MIFYRYILTENGVPMSAELRNGMQDSKGNSFSSKLKQEGYDCIEFCKSNLPVDLNFFIVELQEKFMIMTVIFNGKIQDSPKIDNYVNDFVVFMDLDFLISSRKEITMGGFLLELERAFDHNYILNVREIRDKYDLYINDSLFCECMIKDNETTKEELKEEIKDVVVDDNIHEEIERIFMPQQEEGFAVPIHYMLNMRDEMDVDKVLDVLIKALKANGRIVRGVYSIIDLYSSHRLESVTSGNLRKIFNLNTGGVVVIKARLRVKDDDHYSLDRDVINMLCHQIYMNAEHTTVILCCVGKNQSQIAAFKNELRGNTFLEIADTMLSDEKAKKFLLSIASNYGIGNVSGLVDHIEDGISYTTLDLKEIFSKWHMNYVKTIQFPQYADFVGKEIKIEETVNGNVAYNDLNKLIGLNSVKEIVNNYLNYARLQKACFENGLKVQNTCRHMCFVGNPGTAKTTVARIIAKTMKENGLLSKGDLIEVGRADLVSRFVGGTAPNVQEIFKKAMGNVLFIDEAYSLYDGKKGLFGDEAINAIVQEMENRREDLVVIFAGYKKEMHEFLDANSGLRSRIAYEVEFPDYTEEELMEIANLQANNFDVDISGCEEKIKEIISMGKQGKNFGNGRFVRSVLEKARMKQASRLVNEDKLFGEHIRILKPEDFDMPNIEQKVKMGFC